MSKSVLFIDDDETYLYLLERAAKSVAVESDVYTAKNGKDALEMIEGWRKANQKIPNIMFVDVIMPVMDGFEFLEIFKEQREQYELLKEIVPIVMLTSSMNESDRENALEMGMVEKYVIKPAGVKDTEAMLAGIIL